MGQSRFPGGTGRSEIDARGVPSENGVPSGVHQDNGATRGPMAQRTLSTYGSSPRLAYLSLLAVIPSIAAARHDPVAATRGIRDVGHSRLREVDARQPGACQ